MEKKQKSFSNGVPEGLGDDIEMAVETDGAIPVAAHEAFLFLVGEPASLLIADADALVVDSAQVALSSELVVLLDQLGVDLFVEGLLERSHLVNYIRGDC